MRNPKPRLIREFEMTSGIMDDIKFLVKEKLVDTIVDPDITYIDGSLIHDMYSYVQKSELERAIGNIGYGVVTKIIDGIIYMVNGQPHRLNGPAIILNNGELIWFFNGREVANEKPGNTMYTDGGNVLEILDEEVWDQYFAKSYESKSLNENKRRLYPYELQNISDIQFIIDEGFVSGTTESNGTYYNENELSEILPDVSIRHRLTTMGYGFYTFGDSGSKFWYWGYNYHRVDGPAIEFESNTKSWYFEGTKVAEKLHFESEVEIFEKDLWDKYYEGQENEG